METIKKAEAMKAGWYVPNDANNMPDCVKIRCTSRRRAENGEHTEGRDVGCKVAM